MEESDYKVVRALDELLPKAARPQTAGLSLDIRLYLSENSNDGKLWAAVSFGARKQVQDAPARGSAVTQAVLDELHRLAGGVVGTHRRPGHVDNARLAVVPIPALATSSTPAPTGRVAVEDRLVRVVVVRVPEHHLALVPDETLTEGERLSEQPSKK
jgi:hypothetical protein